MGRGAAMMILLAALAGCAGSEEPPTASVEQAPPPAPVTCPANLGFVKDELVTPYPKLEEYIGKDALDATFTKSVDDMIKDSGGIDQAIAGGERYIAEYQEILKNEAVMRVQFKKNGMDQESIDTYFEAHRDGLTINQAFVDAVKCVRDRQPAPTATKDQSQPAPAS